MARLVTTSGDVNEISIETLLQMQEILGGKIVFLRGLEDWLFAARVNAKELGMNKNPKASHLAGITIYGNVILFEKNELY